MDKEIEYATEFEILARDWSDRFLLGTIKQLKREIHELAEEKEENGLLVMWKVEQLEMLTKIRVERGLA